ARDRVGDLPDMENFSSTPGRGIQGVVDGAAVVAGRPSWLASDWAVTLPAELIAALNAAESAGQTAIAVAWDGVARGVVVVSDTVKCPGHRRVAHPRA
ncbi:heavy metal translocating P-type ATPase, partial [Klebsiella pneumoniae]